MFFLLSFQSYLIDVNHLTLFLRNDYLDEKHNEEEKTIQQTGITIIWKLSDNVEKCECNCLKFEAKNADAIFFIITYSL